MTTSPVEVIRRPARRESRNRDAGVSASHAAESNRNWTAFETLLTFWPPGPEARTARYSMSSSGIASGPRTASGNSGALGGFAEAAGRHLEAHLALCHRNLDAAFLEQAPDRAVDVGPDVVDALLRVR